MAIKHEPEKIVTWQESGPGVRQPKPSGDAYPAGFGLCGAQAMVRPELSALVDRLMDATPYDLVPTTDVEMALLQTGSAFMVLSVGENGVFSRVVDPNKW